MPRPWVPVLEQRRSNLLAVFQVSAQDWSLTSQSLAQQLRSKSIDLLGLTLNWTYAWKYVFSKGQWDCAFVGFIRRDSQSGCCRPRGPCASHWLRPEQIYILWEIWSCLKNCSPFFSSETCRKTCFLMFLYCSYSWLLCFVAEPLNRIRVALHTEHFFW